MRQLYLNVGDRGRVALDMLFLCRKRNQSLPLKALFCICI